MSKRRVMFTFSQALITEPVIYNLGHQFKVVTNIRRADVTEDHGWVILELEGDADAIDQGLKWVSDLGVQVNDMEGDVVSG